MRWTHFQLPILCALVALGIPPSRALAAEGRPVPNGARVVPLPSPSSVPGRSVGFTRIPPSASGVQFTNSLEAQSAANNRILENGSGIALGDVDGDGLCDLYLCRIEGPNALFRNRGNWRFEEVPAAGGAACAGNISSGATLVDLDGDRDLDLLVNGIGTGTRLFLNDATGHFTESTNNRLQRRFGATSMALADLDGDGDLDLYVANYRTTTFRDNPPGLRVDARRTPDGGITVTPADRFLALGVQGDQAEIIERGERDFLYLNRGRGDFAPISWTQGTFLDEDGKPLKEAPTDWGLAVVFRDLNDDGWPDLYVCNDFFLWKDRVWLNRRGAGFQAPDRTWLRHLSLSSMSVDVADIDRDGRMDLFVAEMLGRDLSKRPWQRPNLMTHALQPPLLDPGYRPDVTRNTLHLARAGGGFAEIAPFAGLDSTDWTWSAVFLDVDLDGWEDLLIGNGNLHDVQHADILLEMSTERSVPSPAQRLRDFSRFPSLASTNLAFRNRRDRTFEESGAQWGFDEFGVTTAIALADLDGDGDLDVVTSQLNGSATLLRNDATAPRIAVRLRGEGENPTGIGAKITVSGGPVTQSQEMTAGGRYLSGDDTLRTFAASAGKPHRIEVRWPGGRVSRVDNIPAGSRVEVPFPTGDAPATEPPAPSFPAPLFSSALPTGFHTDPPPVSDDTARQPLLPRLLSREGPGVAVADLDGDGFEDLLFGGEGAAKAYRNRGGAAFEPWPTHDVPASSSRRIAGLLAVPHGSTNPVRVVLAESNWRDGQPDVAAGVVREGTASTPLPRSSTASGALVLADLVGDAFPDLVVASRSLPGRWPESTPTRLLPGGADGFGPPRDLPVSGPVTGLLATDLDGDGGAELVLAEQWGPIHFLRRDGDRWAEWDPGIAFPGGGRASTRLSAWTGLWNGIAAGDFDGDGRMDLVLGNEGWNFGDGRIDPRKATVSLHHGDFGLGGGVHTVVSSPDPSLGRWLVWRDWGTLKSALPFLVETAPDHASLGRLGVEALLGRHAEGARRRTVVEFASRLLLNRGDHFDVLALPDEAQWSPVFGIATADFDGDGALDLFLAQNSFGLDPESARQDAGLGLLLIGDGHGGFRPLSPAESGIALPGEGRGTAVADLDGDGRTDLVTTQVGGPAALFLNRRAAPGWSVRLRGTDANPAALGAQVRPENAGQPGAVHEVRAGGGWWSQDSRRILLTGRRPDAVRVRWPGGREQRVPWPGDSRILEIDARH